MSPNRTSGIAELPESTSAAEATVNGIDVAALSQTVQAVQGNPMIAQFRFQAKNAWIDGSHNRSTVNEFHGAMQDVQRSQSFLIHADEPPILLGKDQGPNAGEFLLHALAACVTSSLIYHAAARGIVVDAVESTVEGDADLRGFLGIDQTVRNGFQNIRMNFQIRADVNDQELQELSALGPKFSPVFDSIINGVPITVQAQRMR